MELKPGGKYIIIVPDFDTYCEYLESFFSEEPKSREEVLPWYSLDLQEHGKIETVSNQQDICSTCFLWVDSPNIRHSICKLCFADIPTEMKKAISEVLL